MVEAEQGDDGEDDCAEEDFGHVVVEDLLVSIGGIGIVFPDDGPGGCDRISFGWCGFVYGHGLLLP